MNHFVTLHIPYFENIIAKQRTDKDGNVFQDFKLTRFACYVTVMNGDPKKEQVALAQTYFASQTRKYELYLENNKQMDRLLIREEDYAKFTNAGYLGMYNMMS